MASAVEFFEVHGQRNGRWTIESTAGLESDAKAAANTLLRASGVTAVKVVKSIELGGTTRETVILQKSRDGGGGGKVFVNEIDDAPYCEDTADLLGARGRGTINRLFRSYLDKSGVTATEVMHDFKELRRAMDADNLMMSAIGKVATLQAKGKDGVDAASRRDELFAFVDDIMARARKASETKLPSIAKSGYEPVISGILDKHGDNGDYFARVAMTRELVQHRDFFGKLVQTLDWAEPAEDTRAQALSDSFIADITSNAGVLQELLGPQEDLASALVCLIDLSQGSLEIEEGGQSDAPDQIARRLNAMLGDDGLSETSSVLVDRVCRQLDGKQPLVKGDPEKEAEAFRDFTIKVMPESDLVGGCQMAEALTQRQSRILNKGGLTGLKEATGRMLPIFRDPVQKAGYLLALKNSRIGADLNGEIDMQLEGLFVRPEKIREIVKDDRPPNKKMEALTAVFHKIHTSDLPDAARTRITEHLDEVLASYIIDDRILTRIDDPSKPMHIRAFMLLSMCTPEVLPEGKASTLAR